MSRRAELEQRLGRLSEITGIMTAMKNMALIETRKYGRFMVHQQRLVDSIESAAADFLSFHPDFRGAPGRADEHQVLILIGSERGFCGDFNESIAAALPGHAGGESRLIVVGRRLAGKLAQDSRVAAWLDGPNVAEEVAPVLDALLDELHRLSFGSELWNRLCVLAHDAGGDVALHVLLPISPTLSPCFGYPPRLNTEPPIFFGALTEHYLAAKLPALFYASLMAENRRRLEHMGAALNRMQTRMDDLARRRNALRQEEITEQIEIILLSVESMLGEMGGN